MKFDDIKSDVLYLIHRKRDYPVYYYVFNKHDDKIDYVVLMNSWNTNLWLLRVIYNENEKDLEERHSQMLSLKCQETNRNTLKDFFRIIFMMNISIFIRGKS